MGDWRRVRITGTCSVEEARGLRTFLEGPMQSGEPLACGGVMGLRWPNGDGSIDSVGDLGERDYGPDDVARHLGTLLVVAPSLRCRVDVGDHYESDRCVASVIVGEDGLTVGVLPPAVEKVPEISETQMQTGFAAELRRAMGRQ